MNYPARCFCVLSPSLSFIRQALKAPVAVIATLAIARAGASGFLAGYVVGDANL
jgi:hypothetical protein